MDVDPGNPLDSNSTVKTPLTSTDIKVNTGLALSKPISTSVDQDNPAGLGQNSPTNACQEEATPTNTNQSSETPTSSSQDSSTTLTNDCQSSATPTSSQEACTTSKDVSQKDEAAKSTQDGQTQTSSTQTSTTQTSTTQTSTITTNISNFLPLSQMPFASTTHLAATELSCETETFAYDSINPATLRTRESSTIPTGQIENPFDSNSPYRTPAILGTTLTLLVALFALLFLLRKTVFAKISGRSSNRNLSPFGSLDVSITSTLVEIPGSTALPKQHQSINSSLINFDATKLSQQKIEV